MPEDVTADRIVSLDDGVIASAPYIAVSDIEELGPSQQRELEEEENNDNDENSIEDSLYQSKGKP